jgi:hypothetical protein
VARPKKEIDENLVLKLASIFCTTDEIAVACECSKDTLERRFAATLKKGRQNAKQSLRRLQFQSAVKGSVPMQIWLGKQYLDQKDKTDISASDVKPFALAYSVADLKKVEKNE